MRRIAIAFALVFALGSISTAPALAQQSDISGAVVLVAAPQLVDPDYRQTVLLAVPVDNNRYVGVIINRPTSRSLSSLFPEHGPSKQVRDPVYFGGPMLRRAIFALVRTDQTPGTGSIQMMKDLYLATQGTVVDSIIEQHPNDARYYVGYVVWQPGELRLEINRGLWSVLDADTDMVFRKSPESMWEELLRRARAVTAWAPVRGGALAIPQL